MSDYQTFADIPDDEIGSDGNGGYIDIPANPSQILDTVAIKSDLGLYFTHPHNAHNAWKLIESADPQRVLRLMEEFTDDDGADWNKIISTLQIKSEG